jgi:beta-glucosidase
VNSVTDIPKVYTRNSTIGEILADTNGKEIFQKTMAQMLGDNAQLIAAQEDNSGAINEEMMTAMAEGMSLRQLLSFIPGVSRNVLEELINKLNKHKFKMEEAQQYWIMRSLLSPPIFPFILEKQFFL